MELPYYTTIHPTTRALQKVENFEASSVSFLPHSIFRVLIEKVITTLRQVLQNSADKNRVAMDNYEYNPESESYVDVVLQVSLKVKVST